MTIADTIHRTSDRLCRRIRQAQAAVALNAENALVATMRAAADRVHESRDAVARAIEGLTEATSEKALLSCWKDLRQARADLAKAEDDLRKARDNYAARRPGADPVPLRDAATGLEFHR